MTTESSAAPALVSAIRTGDVVAIRRLLNTFPDLVSSPLGGSSGARTALHVVTDWPGYFPSGPEVVDVLIRAGADPNTRSPGGETPLHWAASSDDADVADALIEGGALLEVPGGSIGTPLDNAVGYGCWHVARLLVVRGAVVDKLWQAAALGLMGRFSELLAGEPGPDGEALSQAFWHGCAGGQRRAAELLLGRGADLNWVPAYAHGTALDAASRSGTRQENVIAWLREAGARSGEQPT